jgi:hypothetical protein
MNDGMRKIIDDMMLFGKISCWTTILALAAYLLLWAFPDLKARFGLPDKLLFFLLAALAVAIFADQINKRHFRPEKIKNEIEKYK